MLMADVLLVAPPFSYGALDEASPRSPNLGIACVAATLEKAGYSVKVLDMFATASDRQRLLNALGREKPSVVGVSIVTATFDSANKILDAVKAFDSSITTIAGGPHVTTMAEEAMKGKIDYGVIGEGDYSAVELVDFITKKKGKLEDIKGICYKGKNGLAKTKGREFIKNLDELPFPAYHLLPMDSYRPYAALDVGRKFSCMITSRGCPFRCVYCNSSQIFGHLWRCQSAERTLEEMQMLYEKYRIRHIYFQDDEFTVNTKRAEKICNLIIESRMDIIWECLTRVNSVNDNLLRKMRRAGCRSIAYGIEAGYEEGLKLVNKQITLEQAEAAIKLTKKNKIMARASFIIGFPWEGEAEVRKTINFAKKLDADITYFNTLTPYPGTQVFEEIKRKNLFAEDFDLKNYISHGTKPLIRTEKLSSEELSYWNGKAYFELYMRPGYLARKLFEMRNFNNLKRNIKAGIGLLKLARKRTSVVKKE